MTRHPELEAIEVWGDSEVKDINVMLAVGLMLDDRLQEIAVEIAHLRLLLKAKS